jgi:hypothetical protein
MGRRKDQFEIFHETSRYTDPFELALCFRLLPRERDMTLASNFKAGSLLEQTRVSMMVVDRFTIKHYTYD